MEPSLSRNSANKDLTGSEGPPVNTAVATESQRDSDTVEGLVGCTMEIFKTHSLCGKKAEWKNPRWPTGTYCNHHKDLLERFWPGGWEQIANNKVTVATKEK